MSNNIKDIIEKIKNKDDVAIMTSGTTSGTPKCINVPLSKRYENIHKKVFSKNYFLGFMYDLDSWAALGTISFCVKNDIGFSKIESFSDCFDEKFTHLCLTPSQLICVASLELQNFNVLQVTLGGEYSTQSVINLCKHTFPNARITHVYAATEVGDICAVSDGLEGYPKEKFKNFVIFDDKIKINEVFLNDVWKLNEGRYYFIGRSDNRINVAGKLVNLESIERKILNNRIVKDCVVYSKKVPIIENILYMEYVGDVDEPLVRNKLRNILPKHEVPIVKKVFSLELNKNGKKVRLKK